MSTIKIQKADGTFEFLQTAGRDVEDLAQKALKADKKVDEFAVQLAHTMQDLEQRAVNVKSLDVDVLQILVNANKDRKIFMPSGVFFFNKSVTSTDKLLVEGSSETVIRLNNHNICFDINGGELHIENVVFDMQGIGRAFAITNAKKVVIKNCKFINSGTGAIGAISMSDSENITIEGCLVDGSTNHGIRLTDCKNIHISKNVIKNTGSDGVSLRNCNNAVVTNNDIREFVMASVSSGERGGIHVYGSAEGGFTDFVIEGNLLETSSKIKECCGIRVRSSNDRIVISNNVIKGTQTGTRVETGAGILLEPADTANNATQKDIIISNNIVENWNGSYGILARARAIIERVIINANTVHNSLFGGIRVTDDGGTKIETVIISNNIIERYFGGLGLSVLMLSEQARDIIVKGNIIKYSIDQTSSSSSGVSLTGVKGICEGNIISNVQRNGIRITKGEWIVIGNMVQSHNGLLIHELDGAINNCVIFANRITPTSAMYNSLTDTAVLSRQFISIFSATNHVMQTEYGGIIMRKGTTANRPTNNLVSGLSYFDTSINKPIYRNGANNAWVDANGVTV